MLTSGVLLWYSHHPSELGGTEQKLNTSLGGSPEKLSTGTAQKVPESHDCYRKRLCSCGLRCPRVRIVLTTVP